MATFFLGMALSQVPIAQAETPLEAGFHHPPASARPQTWWHWLNGNVTRAGITADLEAMARVGVGGAEIFNVDQGIPAGPVRFMSPQWLDMMKFAASEANRLGLELCMHNCAGWSSSGGPWNTPDHAMQFLTTSERHVHGPLHFDDVLAQPATKLNSYHDIATLAFHTPTAETTTMHAAAPQVTTSVPGVVAAQLVDGNAGSYVALPAPTANDPNWVQLTFAAPFRARTLSLQTGPGRNEGGGKLEVSDDGQQFRQISPFGLTRESRNPHFGFEPTTARYWRVTFNRRINLAEVDLSAEVRIGNIEGKAAFVRSDHPGASPAPDQTATDAVISNVVDVSAHMQPNGHLTWDVPEGDWTILRFGHTPTGATNEPGPPEATGPECDKLSREAVDAHWAGAVAPVLKALGPLAGKSFNDVLIDSYEVGSQNWTPRFREEFRARRGYDPVPWLPVTTGRVVESPAASERFLWDLRRTVCDLFAANYAGRFAQLAHQNGLMFSAEPYGNGSFEDFQYGGSADIPMGEFWVGDSGSSSCKLAASVGHIYGRKFVGAESFTAVPQHARWTNDPYSLKALGDLIYCSGINRFIFHRYAMQPWTDKAPGMTMGPWGIHFERTETWWNQGAAWLSYVSRCQYLLQQGLFVADVATFCGDDTPNTLQGPQGLPTGYDYDGINPEVLQKRLAVRNGRLVLPDGMSYRVLTLPNTDAMTPATLRRLSDLVRGGAVVLGPRPTHSPSLQDFPRADAEVKQLAYVLWGDINGKTVTEHNFGQGHVFWGKTLPEVLAALRLKPDFEVAEAPTGQVHYIHRVAAGADLYFVASSTTRDQEVRCTFRVAGRQPELWHPDTGLMEACPVWRQVGDRTEMPLRFTPSGSVFVVFRRPATNNHLVSVERQGPEAARPKPAELTIVKAVYGVLNAGSDKVDVTRQVQDMVRQGQRRITANNSLAGDPAADEVKEMLLEFELNGARQSQRLIEGQSFDLPAGATVTRAIYGLNPEAAPDAAQTMDLTAQLAGLVRDGQLHVVVGNALAGRDPALNTPKQFSVEYILNGVHKNVTLGENQTLDLPGDLPGSSLPPAFEVQQTANGARRLLVNAPGHITLTQANGRKQQMEVSALPAPISVPGPWQVTFPPHLGAPPQTVFDRLISWPQATDPGVQYFSGTATYHTSFVVPPALIKSGRQFSLNLGSVQVIAEPVLNGHALGVLWKPPFRTDVTGILRPGMNTLEVQVTNLWPNRMIGDEQFPEDIKYTAGGNIAEWPQWLLHGTPRPEPRRITFSTWKHWHKGDDLLPSGLLGPVAIETAQQIPLH
ncbi:MAG: hypothetical protein JO316_18790 [Abitibacteriaceae bacterium]|nr:hypothetical protein [Abditibacteriaceae bacterium]